jgi:hypothetical protein
MRYFLLIISCAGVLYMLTPVLFSYGPVDHALSPQPGTVEAYNYPYPPSINVLVLSRPVSNGSFDPYTIKVEPVFEKISFKRSAKYEVEQLERAINEADTGLANAWIFDPGLKEPAAKMEGSDISKAAYIMDIDKNGEEDVMFYYYRAADDNMWVIFTQRKGRYERFYNGHGRLSRFDLGEDGKLERLVAYHYACCMYNRDHIEEINFSWSDTAIKTVQQWTLLYRANDTLPPDLKLRSRFIVEKEVYLQNFISKKNEVTKGIGGYHGSYLLKPEDKGAVYGSLKNATGETWLFVIADPARRGRYEEGHFCGWVRELDVKLLPGH